MKEEILETTRKTISAQDMSVEQYNDFLSRIGQVLYRKPSEWPEISSVRLFNLHPSVIGVLNNLPVVEGAESPMDYFLDGKQQFYIVKADDGVFFVDTQGYDYARYAVRLIDYFGPLD